MVGDGAVFAHIAPQPMVEDGIELRGAGAQGPDVREILLVARQGGETGETGMGRPMVDLLGPRPEPGVQIIEFERRAEGDLAQELRA